MAIDEQFRLQSSMTDGGVVTIYVTGEVDMATAPEIEDVLDRWPETRELIVDLSQCPFLDSRGIHALVVCRKQLGPDAIMRLVGVTPNVAKVLTIAGVRRYLDTGKP
jgi:anti-sigma B factor antagonist